jgi:hypothetical protein
MEKNKLCNKNKYMYTEIVFYRDVQKVFGHCNFLLNIFHIKPHFLKTLFPILWVHKLSTKLNFERQKFYTCICFYYIICFFPFMSVINFFSLSKFSPYLLCDSCFFDCKTMPPFFRIFFFRNNWNTTIETENVQ